MTHGPGQWCGDGLWERRWAGWRRTKGGKWDNCNRIKRKSKKKKKEKVVIQFFDVPPKYISYLKSQERYLQIWMDLKNILPYTLLCIYLKILLIFREREGREKERDRNINVCPPPSYWEPGPHPRHVSSLGITPAALWFSGRHSIHWAAPARALHPF